MSQVTLEYEAPRGGQVSSEQVSPDDLLDKIDAIKRRNQNGLQAPYGMDVVNAKGDRLTVAFDSREGFLMLQPGPDDEWTHYSLGDVHRSDVKAFMLPTWTELSGKYMVPTSKLRDAVQHWANTGKRGVEIRWTTELY